MHIGIIAAMDEELSFLKQSINISDVVDIAGITFYKGDLGDISVVIVQSGIGKSAAAMAATLLYAHFNVSHIYNTGTAGGLGADVAIGDVIVGTKIAYFDVDVTAFGYKLGQVPNNPEYYSSSKELVETAIAQDIKHKTKQYQVHTGMILSGDTFVSNIEQKDDILANFNAAQALDMESAAIAQVCSKFNIPFIVVRSISDNAGESANELFKGNLLTASKNATDFLISLIKTETYKACELKVCS